MEKKLFLLKIQIFDVNELVECNLFVQLQHLGYFFDTSITPFFFFFTPHYLDFSHLTVDWLWVFTSRLFNGDSRSQNLLGMC